MDWHFCPHCETQLDADTFICPACRWDPLATSETAPTAVQPSLMERYRGTEFDATGWNPAAASVTASAPLSRTAHRVRAIMVVAFIAIVGLYGSMLVYTDADAHRDQPAAALALHR